MAVEHLRVQMEMTLGSEGFSEVIYHSGSSPKSFAENARLLATERKKILVNVGKLHHIRVSGATPGARAYRLAVLNPAGAISSRRDVGSVTTTVGVYAENGSFRKMQLRGLPDSDHRFDALGNADISLSKGVETYLRFLISAGYEIRHKTKTANDETLKTISGITVVNGVVTFSVDATGFVAGDKIIVSGCKGAKANQFNGTWSVGQLLDPITTGFKAATRRLIDPGFIYVAGSGRIRSGKPEGWGYSPIKEYDETAQDGTKKTGRPTDSHRGRR